MSKTKKGNNNKNKSYTITHNFIPRPGWQKDYNEALEVFLRILSNDETGGHLVNSKPSQNVS